MLLQEYKKQTRGNTICLLSIHLKTKNLMNYVYGYAHAPKAITLRSQKSVILHTFQPSVTRTPSAPGRPPAANL